MNLTEAASFTTQKVHQNGLGIHWGLTQKVHQNDFLVQG